VGGWADLDPAVVASVHAAPYALRSNHDWDGVFNLLRRVV
jgi:hypothetical protein